MTELASLAAVSAAAARRDHLGAPPPAEASAQPGGEGLPSLPEARAVAAGPKWYRLPEASWAMIRAEYLAGATAKQLALKWGVSTTSVYRHACKEGFTKARRGEAINLEAVTRFAARAAEVEARARVEAVAAAQAQVAAEAEARREGELEADPLETAWTLLRRAAGSALGGRCGPAEAVKLAEGLARAARTISDAEMGIAEAHGRLVDEAVAAVEADPRFAEAEAELSPEEVEALRASVIASFMRLRADRMRQKAFNYGKGWATAGADDDPGYGFEEDGAGGRDVEAGGAGAEGGGGDDAAAASGGLDGSDAPWPALRRQRPLGLSEPAVSIADKVWPPDS